jgi:hypothetical protein
VRLFARMSCVVAAVAAAVAASSSSGASDTRELLLADRLGNATVVTQGAPTTVVAEKPTPNSPPTTRPPTATTVTPTATTVTPTTVRPTATTLPSPATTTTTAPNPDGANEGRMKLLLRAQSGFDRWTGSSNPSTWATLNADYDAMIAYSPFFDASVPRFANEEFVYTDLYGLHANLAGDTTAADHPDWLLRTANGAAVYLPWGCGVPTGCPQYAADVGNPGFQAAFVERIGRLLSKGYTGVVIDDVNLIRRFGDINGNDINPINPRTGNPMQVSEWRVAVVALLERVRTTYPNARIMHNSIWFADTPTLNNVNVDRQIRAADVVMLERGANDAGLTGGTGSYSYSKFIAFIDRVHRLGADVLLLDQVATTDAQQMFNLATGLLVNNGNDFVSTQNIKWITPGSVWAGFDTDLGDALGAHTQQNGIWRRDFTDGIVVLNGPGTATQTVQLGGTFLTSGGQAVTSIVLGPRQAAILRRP